MSIFESVIPKFGTFKLSESSMVTSPSQKIGKSKTLSLVSSIVRLFISSLYVAFSATRLHADEFSQEVTLRSWNSRLFLLEVADSKVISNFSDSSRDPSRILIS